MPWTKKKNTDQICPQILVHPGSLWVLETFGQVHPSLLCGRQDQEHHLHPWSRAVLAYQVTLGYRPHQVGRGVLSMKQSMVCQQVQWTQTCGPRCTLRRQNQKLSVGTWISCFALSLIKSCSVERSRPSHFNSLNCLFLCFSSSHSYSWTLLGLTVNQCQWNSYLHCCHPATTIICCSGPTLIKGYLLFTQLQMKIGIASWNEDNTY